MKGVKILLEDTDPNALNKKKLTTDCYLVVRKTGEKDIVRAKKMVDVFDFYYDRCILLSKIDFAGGTRNPKFQEPELEFTSR